jgi:type VI secretion system secreted protein VgrG
MVVGPKGEEIYTDQHGRVKVQFHWDRYGKRDENSSCWVRVSHPWAGKNWGMIALPRIGQEVIVDFLEGNPDQPIITGRVYNAASMPPYPLPDYAHLSTIKTNSTKGGGGFNEIRFDDKKGSEQLFFHAERNQDVRVKNDSFTWIGNEQHLTVKKDQFEQIDGDSHSTIKGDRNEAIKGTLSIKADMDMQEKVGMKHALDAGQEIHLKAGMNVVIEAGMTITLKAGGGFIVIGPTGVTISGTPVLINSGGSAGSGSGSSPEVPKAPKEAANAKPGKVDEATPAPQPPKPKTYGPSATVLKLAAQNGTPFCEKCAAAAAAASAK